MASPSQSISSVGLQHWRRQQQPLGPRLLWWYQHCSGTSKPPQRKRSTKRRRLIWYAMTKKKQLHGFVPFVVTKIVNTHIGKKCQPSGRDVDTRQSTGILANHADWLLAVYRSMDPAIDPWSHWSPTNRTRPGYSTYLPPRLRWLQHHTNLETPMVSSANEQARLSILIILNP